MEYVILKMILSLVAVLGLMVLVLFLMKKFVSGGGITASSAVDIELLGMRTLHQKRSVYVLRVVDKVIVVGATDNTMQTLADISDAKSSKKIDTLIAESAKQVRKPKWFSLGKSREETIKMPFARILSKYTGASEAALKPKKTI